MNRKSTLIYFLALCIVATACSHSVATNTNNDTNDDDSIGVLSSAELDEVSGAAVSRLHPNLFYVHNDSGDDSRFFAINRQGQLLTTYNFSGIAGGAGVVDCEDIAMGPGPEQGRSYIYLGDIGDNMGMRSSVQVYRFAEPDSTGQPKITVEAAAAHLHYPDGPRDAETIMADPVQRMLYIVSKREDTAGIYRCPLDFQNGDTVQLELCGKLFLEGSGSSKWIVAGDIAADGNSVILKTVSSVYYWKRNGTEPICTTLQRQPVKQSAYMIHGQEEAIAFAPAADGYYVLSEGKYSKIYYYKLQK